MIRPLSEIMQELARNVDHLRVRPRNALAFLTYRCTSRCRTCNIWRREAAGVTELDAAAWRRIVDYLAEAGVESLEIFGGDALLRKEVLYDLIAYCRERSLATFFPTNSLLLDREAARELVQAGLHTIYFSLDEPEDAGIDVRGVEDHAGRVRRAMEDVLAERGEGGHPHVVVLTTVSALNAGRVADVVALLRGLPVDAYYPRPVMAFSPEAIQDSSVEGELPSPYFVPQPGERLLLTPEQVVSLRRTLRILVNREKRQGGLYINTRTLDMIPDHSLTTGEYAPAVCYAASTLVTVTPEGRAVPCPFFDGYDIGDLREGLASVWGNERHRRFLDLQRRGRIGICRNCNFRLYYPGYREILAYYGRRLVEKLWPRS